MSKGKKKPGRIVNIPAEFVERCDTFHLERVLRELVEDPQNARTVQGTVMLSFEDYEDAEVVFLVPKVREFLRKAHERIPHLFYFLAPHPALGNRLAFAGVHSAPAAVKVEHGQVMVDLRDEALELFVGKLLATAQFAREMGDDPVRIVTENTQDFEKRFREEIVSAVTEHFG